MNEADAKRAIVENIKSRGGYARRIEDNFGVGFPDLVVQTSAYYPVFFIEAKIVDGHHFGPTPRQYVELKRLAISRYSHPMIAGFSLISRKWFLHPYAEKAHVKDCFRQTERDFYDTLESYYEVFKTGAWE